MSDLRAVGGAPGAPGPDPHEALRRAAKDFEGVFLSYVFRAMRDTVPEEPGDGDQGRGMFTAMFDDTLAGLAAHQQAGSLSDALYRQLARHLPAEVPDAGER